MGSLRAWWSRASLRARVACELVVLGAATLLFLIAFPSRSILVDLPLALLGLALIALNARYTRQVIWARPAGPPAGRGFLVPAATAASVAVFLLGGAAIGYHASGWHGAWSRVFRVEILGAFAFYLAWALVQQTLFQFYLLGRLRRLLPGVSAPALCALSGLAFAAVHWPQPLLMALTAAAGAVWSYSYLEEGRLWPLALSHAALGSTFYYWIYGRDLAAVWLALVAR